MKKGPLFAQIILADEINRAPGQGAGRAAGGHAGASGHHRRHDLPLEEPFLVLATQNPIENEGTYPLPEAQLDRFMLKVRVGYPTRDEEKEVLLRMSGGQEIAVERLLDPAAILAARAPSPSSTWTRRWWTTSSTWCARPAIPARSAWPSSSR